MVKSKVIIKQLEEGQLTDEQEIFELIRQNLPENLCYSSEGGLTDECKIWGTREDVFNFVQAIYEEGYEQHRKDILGEKLYYD